MAIFSLMFLKRLKHESVNSLIIHIVKPSFIYQLFIIYFAIFPFKCVIRNQLNLTYQSWHFVLIVTKLFLAYLTSLLPRFMLNEINLITKYYAPKEICTLLDFALIRFRHPKLHYLFLPFTLTVEICTD